MHILEILFIHAVWEDRLEFLVLPGFCLLLFPGICSSHEREFWEIYDQNLLGLILSNLSTQHQSWDRLL